MDERAIHALVSRLARPSGQGRHVVEGAAIRAEGSDFDAVEAWILARGGRREPEPPKKATGRGLHADRFADSEAHKNLHTSRYELPAGALDFPPDAPADEVQSPEPDVPDAPGTPGSDPRGE